MFIKYVNQMFLDISIELFHSLQQRLAGFYLSWHFFALRNLIFFVLNISLVLTKL